MVVEFFGEPRVALRQHFDLCADHFLRQEFGPLLFVKGVKVSQDFIQHEVNLTPEHRQDAEVMKLCGVERDGKRRVD